MGGRDRCDYIIHACLDREWYVNDFLIPSMLRQGIERDQIEVWMDRDQLGNLLSCMKCFEYCGENNVGGRWHLQDDVVISSDFKQTTEMFDEGVVSGFMREEWQSFRPESGRVPAVFHWNSFQCIRIPDEYAGECAEWFFTDAAYRDVYSKMVEDGKCDDSFWYDFLCEKHLDDFVTNLDPSIVDHVDFLIGGSVINQWRGHFARGDRWVDEESFNKLKDELARRK